MCVLMEIFISNDTYCMLTYSIQFVRLCYNGGGCMDVLKVFSDNLRKYRNQANLSQESFAERAGLHRTYISAIECRKRSISLENVQKIADALEIETYKLFIDSDKSKKITNGKGGRR